jgi:hypothetical protein
MKLKFCLIAILAAALFNTSCEEKDDNKISRAQACLDKLDDSAGDAVTQAQACENIVAGMNTAESYVIRCSVDFIYGGLVTSAILAAYDAYKAATSHQVATLIGALSQSGVTEAQTTVDNCKKTGVPSLDYLATISYVGTQMTDGSSNTDPATFPADCAAGSPALCANQEVGTALISMSERYCIGDTANNSTCKAVLSAIKSTGGNPIAVASAFFLILAQ